MDAAMKFEMLYLPVPDLAKALAFYRDGLGWAEVWREGETTAGLQLPGTEALVMLDLDQGDGHRPGPIFAVDDVVEFHRERKDELSFWLEPSEIPDGHWAGFEDSFGNPVYIIDQNQA
jgi:catechol 2,3-dioxygenase-like lactoylglutathione lyase family enzyme